jgi:AraC-like DNA-binding protein
VRNSPSETFRTGLVPRARRLEYWNEVATSTFGDIAIDALQPDFSANLKRVRLGGVTLASVTSSPARINGVRNASGVTEGWFLLLNEWGTSRMSQRSREVCLQPGELTALRSDERYRIEFSQLNKTIVLHLPGDARHIDLERHVARKHGVNETPLFTALMRQLETHEPRVDLSRFEQLAIDIARLSWPAPARTARRESMLLWEHRIRQHVHDNLHDPQLNAASIARRFGVSSRFVHMVFASIGQTAGSLILDRRLAAAAAHLRTDPAARITDVALTAGFSDLSQFCRAFRRRFGVSARDYRGTR